MKLAILGAGKQARGVVEYLFRTYWFQGNPSRSTPCPEIVIADASLTAAQTLRDDYPEMRMAAVAIDASTFGKMSEFLQEFDSAISCLPYYLNGELTLAAIKARCNLCDLGGNNEIVARQLSYNELARLNDVTIVPDCGLAPGFVSVLAAEAIGDGFNDIKIRVGGLPLKPVGLLEYGNYFSIEGLINEYIEPVITLDKGIIKTIEPLSQYEKIKLFEQDGFEAFSTSGGISTLPLTYKGQDCSISYQTIRYDGHHRVIKSLQSVDQLNVSNMQRLLEIDEQTRARSKYSGALDVVYIQIFATFHGKLGGVSRTRVYECAVRNGPTMNLVARKPITAMMKATAFPAAITMLMLKELPSGVYTQETVIEPKLLKAKLREAEIQILIKETVYLD